MRQTDRQTGSDREGRERQADRHRHIWSSIYSTHGKDFNVCIYSIKLKRQQNPIKKTGEACLRRAGIVTAFTDSYL